MKRERATADNVTNALRTANADNLEMLPVGWDRSTVGEMVEDLQYGTSAKTSEDASGVPVLRMGNIKDGSLLLDSLKYLPTDHEEFPAQLLQDGDLLFNRTNSAELVGKTAVYRGNPSPCSCASYLIRARLRSGYIPEFLAYYINSSFGRAWVNSVVSQQVGQANVNGTKLKALSVPVPPLPEQHRIVAEIEKQFTRLEAGMAALRRVQANLKRYRAAVLKAACEGRLVPTEAELAKTGKRKAAFESGEALLARLLVERRKNWQGRGQYKEAPQPEVLGLAKLPDGWIWSSLAQLSAHITDGTHKTPTYLQSGVPFLSAKDIAGFKLSFDECRYIPKAEHAELSGRCAVRRGNVLITKSGTIGRVAVVDTDQVFSLFESVANVPVTPPISAKFVAFASYVGIAGVFGATNQKGVAVRHLHLEDLRRVPIPLPPLAEQTRIVAEVERRLSVVEELESVVAANLQRAARLRQSILQKAFTGQLLRCTSGLSKGAQT